MRGAWWSRALIISVFGSALMVGVEAQTTDAVCLPYFDWMSNSQHQSPCLVAAGLLAVCNGGSYNVEALPESTHYLGPLSIFNSNPCQCNTVTYSLMSACAACQARSYLSWSEWTANCPSVSSGFPAPLPTGLHVPAWAYLDPRPSDDFDQIRAQQNTNLTESVVLPPPTSTSTSAQPTGTQKSKAAHSASHNTSSSVIKHSTTSSTPTSVPAETATTEANDRATNTHQANMVGGVAVGASIGGLLILGALIWWINSRLTIRRKKSAIQLISPIEEKLPHDLEQGPTIIVEDEEMLERHEVATTERMQHHITVTIPENQAPSSSNMGSLPRASIHTDSEAPTPTQATYNRHA